MFAEDFFFFLAVNERFYQQLQNAATYALGRKHLGSK